jgi:hypothetical protein
MFNTTRLPAKSLLLTSAKLLPTSENSGAFDPTAGNSPIVFTGPPFKVTFDMILFIEMFT